MEHLSVALGWAEWGVKEISEFISYDDDDDDDDGHGHTMAETETVERYEELLTVCPVLEEEFAQQESTRAAEEAPPAPVLVVDNPSKPVHISLADLVAKNEGKSKVRGPNFSPGQVYTRFDDSSTFLDTKRPKQLQTSSGASIVFARVLIYCMSAWVCIVIIACAILFVLDPAILDARAAAAASPANRTDTARWHRWPQLGDRHIATTKKRHQRDVAAAAERVASTQTLRAWQDTYGSQAPTRDECCHALEFSDDADGGMIHLRSTNFDTWSHGSLRYIRMITGDVGEMLERREYLLRTPEKDVEEHMRIPLGPFGAALQLPPDGTPQYYALDCRWTCCISEMTLAMHDPVFSALADLLNHDVFTVEIQYPDTFIDQRHWRPGKRGNRVNMHTVTDSDGKARPLSSRGRAPNKGGLLDTPVLHSTHIHGEVFVWHHDEDSRCGAQLWHGSDGSFVIISVAINPAIEERFRTRAMAKEKISAIPQSSWARLQEMFESPKNHPIHVDVASVHTCFYGDGIFNSISTEGDAPPWCVDNAYEQRMIDERGGLY